MTEDEAKNKWCPQSRMTEGPAGDILSNRPQNYGSSCIASECMAWHWLYPERDREGYCGLAGTS